MKALVLYRSYHGNTKQVADTIAKELSAQGIESEVRDLRMAISWGRRHFPQDGEYPRFKCMPQNSPL